MRLFVISVEDLVVTCLKPNRAGCNTSALRKCFIYFLSNFYVVLVLHRTISKIIIIFGHKQKKHLVFQLNFCTLTQISNYCLVLVFLNSNLVTNWKWNNKTLGRVENQLSFYWTLSKKFRPKCMGRKIIYFHFNHWKTSRLMIFTTCANMAELKRISVSNSMETGCNEVNKYQWPAPVNAIRQPLIFDTRGKRGQCQPLHADSQHQHVGLYWPLRVVSKDGGLCVTDL